MKVFIAISLGLASLIGMLFQAWWMLLPGLIHWQAIPAIVGLGCFGWLLGELTR